MSKYTLIGPAEPLDPSHKRSKYSLVQDEQPNNMLSKENAQKIDLPFFQKYVVPFASGGIESVINPFIAAKNLGNEPYQKHLGIPLVPEVNFKNVLPEGYSQTAYSAGQFAPALGVGASLAKTLAKSLYQSPFTKSMSATRTGEAAIEKGHKLKEEAKKGFSEIFQEVRDAGISKISHKYSLKNLKAILKGIPEKNTGSLKEYIRTNDPEAAHWAQSDLGKYATMIENKAKKGTSTEHLDALARKARKIQKDLLKKIHESLKNQNRPDIYSKYQNARASYGAKTAPIVYQKDIVKGMQGEISPQELTKRLMAEGGYKLRKNYGKEFPELANRERLKKLLIGSGAVGTTAGGLYGIGKLFGKL